MSADSNNAEPAEKVALSLLHAVARAEKKPLTGPITHGDRTYILDTYAECLEAAQGKRVWKK